MLHVHGESDAILLMQFVSKAEKRVPFHSIDKSQHGGISNLILRPLPQTSDLVAAVFTFSFRASCISGGHLDSAFE